MRLSKIKLAGFKSFVDPTVLSFPSDLVSILGPNGCGKSNTIDAVRWVLGESSAKNLRGESMTDVIFNGSSGRKPVGQCMVELIFDNSINKHAENAITGEFAQYNEISVKRTVNRDAKSQYYLNNIRCRRRDVTDLFLGTGLGPRSYSIIEQGMISRLIESKPEELRVYIEEAAGISKYKERRRETENRIRHTRENLARLDDIRLELDKQLTHLQRQSKTAQRYTELKKQERLIKAQLQAIRWDSIDKKAGQSDTIVAEKEIALEQLMAELRSIEAGIEESRELHIDANESFNSIQGQFYQIGSDIARVEQAISHAKDKSQQYQDDLEQAEQSYKNIKSHLLEDEEKLESFTSQLAEIEPEFEQSKALEEHSAQILQNFEASMQDWQLRWDEFNQQAQEPTQTAQIERSKISQLEQNVSRQEGKIEKLQDELQQFSTISLDESLNNLQHEITESEKMTQDLQQQLNQERESIQNLRDANHQLNNQLDNYRSDLQSFKGRKASLDALQQAALGKNDQFLKQWMDEQGIVDKPRIAEQISVKQGWEQAVECVLGDYLEASCVEQIETLSPHFETLQQSNLTLIETSELDYEVEEINSVIFLPLLQTFIDGQTDLLKPCLNGVYAADNLETGLAHRKKLHLNQSIITKEGIWVGPNWLRLLNDSDQKSGVLAREQEINMLSEELQQARQLVDDLDLQIEQGRSGLREVEHNRENLQTEFNCQNRKLSDLRSQLNTKQSRLDQMNQREVRIHSDIQEIKQQIEEEKILTEESTERLHTALEMIEEFALQREELTQERESHKEQLEESRIKAREDREQSHALEIRLRGFKTELNSTEQGMTRLKGQLDQVSIRRKNLLDQLKNKEDPVEQLNEELELHLESRIQVEEKLIEARQLVEELDQSLREYDHQRARIEQNLLALRTELENVRINSQELIVRRETLKEQIDETGFSLEELFISIPQEASEVLWKSQVDDLIQRIQRLGSINLAAIDEFKEQSERKNHLDAQNSDLIKALDTLEGAIAKIDRETRTRFRETFDKINSGVQRLFPKLFGGGHAYLDLTGDDLLNTGVTIMARPPGKRNSTIHLLSGGEKAMTAVSLVFAIFELNPSPFCMLDEVDAPLDEANVVRFCAMVKEMSHNVQFIYITHNKTTMEMSDHLCGVTMKEPGVSRIVDVDIHEAVEMVEA
ncbi:MAG: chromosome segregation protein SMC [gamma proteobacterium symbiont of Taylorina sp.]|nr:chromosome segregation protein SMC [gamma proteobacterium symbiont of Taylorina sp.]